MGAAGKLMVAFVEDLCTGDGICEEIAPDVFIGRDDGLWTVKEQANHFGADLFFDAEDAPGHGPEGARGVARVPDALIDDVIEAAEECPGECIMIEPYNETAIANRGV